MVPRLVSGIAVGAALVLAAIVWVPPGAVAIALAEGACSVDDGAAHPVQELMEALPPPCDPATRLAEILRTIRGDTAAWRARLDALERTWHKRPMRFLGYLDDMNGYVLRSLVAAAEHSGVDPYLLTTTLFQEGLNTVVETYSDWGHRYYQPQEWTIDGFGSIGADAFGSMMAQLQAQGYLRADYDGIEYQPAPVLDADGNDTGKTDPYWTNEAGDRFLRYYFRNLEAAAEGVAALLAWSNDRLAHDAQTLGIDLNAMTPAERDAWSYLYYNTGIGTGRRLLARWNGKLPERFQQNFLNAANNARRAGATSELYRSLELFCG